MVKLMMMGPIMLLIKKNNINLNPSDIKDKIIIYERQVKGWFIEPTLKMINYNSRHKGFLVLMSCLSYFEAVEQYKTGQSSRGNSKEIFTNSIQKIYPNQFTPQVIAKLYDQGRCGLFHDGMVKGQIIINYTYKKSIVFTDSDIKINPRKMLSDIVEDFENYLTLLRTNIEAQENFNKMFSNLT